MSRERNMGSNPLQTTAILICKMIKNIAGQSSWQLVWLITIRSEVRVLLPLLSVMSLCNVDKLFTSYTSIHLQCNKNTTLRSVRLADTYFGKSGRVAVLRGGWPHGFESRTDYRDNIQVGNYLSVCSSSGVTSVAQDVSSSVRQLRRTRGFESRTDYGRIHT